MTTIDATNSTGDVTLVADTVTTITFSRGVGEDPLMINVFPYVDDVLGKLFSHYKGFRIVNNDNVEVIYYTVAYDDNELLEPEIGAPGTYRLNAGITDQWITAPMIPKSIKISLISSGAPDYNVEAW